MFFRNLIIFRMNQAWTLSAQALSEKLKSAPFQACGKMDRQSMGFCKPVDHAAEDFVHAVGGQYLVNLCAEDKILPASVVQTFVDDKVKEIEEQQGRKVGKKERKEIAERVEDELLPRAFTRRRKTTALIMPEQGWLIVDSSAPGKAEEIIEWLRKVEAVSVRPLNTLTSPTVAMTAWLADGEAPEPFGLESECELQLPEEDGAIVRCIRQDVHTDEVRNHLATGKCATKLALTWADKMSFVLNESLGIRRLTFLDLVQDQCKAAGAADAAEQWDANIAIMSGEMALFLPDLIQAMGGEKPQDNKASSNSSDLPAG